MIIMTILLIMIIKTLIMMLTIIIKKEIVLYNQRYDHFKNKYESKFF